MNVHRQHKRFQYPCWILEPPTLPRNHHRNELRNNTINNLKNNPPKYTLLANTVLLTVSHWNSRILRILVVRIEILNILVTLTSHSIQGVINPNTQHDSAPSNVRYACNDSNNKSSIRMNSIATCTQGHLKNKHTHSSFCNVKQVEVLVLLWMRWKRELLIKVSCKKPLPSSLPMWFNNTMYRLQSSGEAYVKLLAKKCNAILRQGNLYKHNSTHFMTQIIHRFSIFTVKGSIPRFRFAQESSGVQKV